MRSFAFAALPLILIACSADNATGQNSAASAERPFKTSVIADFDSPGDEDIFTKVRADLETKSIEISDHILDKRLQEFRQLALEQIKTE